MVALSTAVGVFTLASAVRDTNAHLVVIDLGSRCLGEQASAALSDRCDQVQAFANGYFDKANGYFDKAKGYLLGGGESGDSHDKLGDGESGSKKGGFELLKNGLVVLANGMKNPWSSAAAMLRIINSSV